MDLVPGTVVVQYSGSPLLVTSTSYCMAYFYRERYSTGLRGTGSEELLFVKATTKADAALETIEDENKGINQQDHGKLE